MHKFMWVCGALVASVSVLGCGNTSGQVSGGGGADAGTDTGGIDASPADADMAAPAGADAVLPADATASNDLGETSDIELKQDIGKAGDLGADVCACGDGVCTAACAETAASCPADCLGCGNGVCEPGEGPKSCPTDCCGTCGDGQCKGYDCGESKESCPADCGNACGNKVCDKGESPSTCAEDCTWQVCGNGVCEPSDGGPDKCKQDCTASCGDGLCNKAEDFLSCPVDCGYCGDGVCSLLLKESSASCPADCKIGECNPDLPEGVTKCDDANPCTIDQCTPAGSCKHPTTQGDCDDGSLCTVGDHCAFGSCLADGALDCSDANPCTADACNPLTGCAHKATSAACSDGDACTVGDVCKASACAPGPALDCEDGSPCTDNACELSYGCTSVAIDAACTDGDLCTAGDTCVAGVCLGAKSLDCDDGNPCTTDSCKSESGCAHQAAIGACQDGNACTTGDACVGGVCTAGAVLGCSDDNACTADSCDSVMGCSHKPAAGACDDGNACTVGDGCKLGACAGGALLSCDDGNPCTSDGCEAASGCAVTLADGATCSDGDVCTGGDVCAAGGCQGGKNLGCDDGNPCTSDACNGATGCTHQAASGACEDGNSCTSGDVCMNAVCTSGNGIDCSDANACTIDQCDALGGCHHTAASGACTDGDACTIGDACKEGGCASGPTLDCGDGNVCTDDSCASGSGCVHMAGGATCTDGNACTVGDGCQNGGCVAGAAAGCDDANVCTTDLCDPSGGCGHKAQQGACDDGNACTVADLCKQGLCAGGAQRDCDDSDPCTSDSCDAKSGCAWVVVDGAACSDGDVCSAGDACKGGACVAGKALACDDGNPCSIDACNAASGCTHKAADGPCSDGNACSQGDNCQNTVCTPGPSINCDDAQPCTADSCVASSGCVHLDISSGACNDGDLCTSGDACNGGACLGIGVLDCQDGNACTTDACYPQGGCVHLANAATCTDGNACTVGDGCQNGGCVPGPAAGCDDSNACTSDACDAAGGCVHKAAQGACDDGNICTVGDVCAAGSCSGGAPQTCDDANVCTDDLCTPVSGCSNLANKKGCNDGDACTSADACQQGSCHGLAAACDDGNPCTLDDCDALAGCLHAKLSLSACDDGDACTIGDLCLVGKCSGSALSCEDDNACTNDTCLPATGCQHVAAIHPCSDGNACTIKDACAAGVCIGVGVACEDNLPCTLDGCDPSSGCLHSATSGTPCDDGDACTMAEVCLVGSCKGMAIKCDDANVCTDDSCAPASGCIHAPAVHPCLDGDACTASDACQGGLCIGAAITCDDGNVCTFDGCDAASGCVTGNTGSIACSDGNACTGGDTCLAGKCKGSLVDCDDGKPCTDDACLTASGCAHTFAAHACSDGDACTSGDACAAGVCVGAAANCDDGSTCTIDGCDKQKGCVYVQLTGIDCTDGNPCTQKDACVGGSCQGAVVTCSDGNPCTDDSCVAFQGCAFVPNSADCDDGSKCTTGDACIGGACKGAALGCNDSQVCTDDACDPQTGCTHAPSSAACDDGDACTENDVCANLGCHGAAIPPTACDDGVACTVDACSPSTGCTHTATQTLCTDFNSCTDEFCDALAGCQYPAHVGTCTDGNPCTEGDACQGTTCVPTGPTVCDDGNPCTDDSCDDTTGCVFVNDDSNVLTGSCVIEGDDCSLGHQACLAGKTDCRWVGTPNLAMVGKPCSLGTGLCREALCLPPVQIVGTFTPRPVKSGNVATLTVTVSHPGNNSALGVNHISTVSVDASSIGLGSAVVLGWQGLTDDVTAVQYSGTFATSGQQPGPKLLPVHVTDDSGKTTSSVAPLYVYNGLLEVGPMSAYKTIGEALDAATWDVETILVHPGVYTGTGNKGLDINNRFILSSDGPGVTVVDCEGAGWAMSPGAGSGTGGWSAVAGLTFTHCVQSAIFSGGPALTVVEAAFLSNSSDSGGAIRTAAGLLTVALSRFQGNVASTGGAIQAWGNGGLTMIASQVLRNDGQWAGGGVLSGFGPLNVQDSVVVGNVAAQGGGGGCSVVTGPANTVNGPIVWAMTDVRFVANRAMESTVDGGPQGLGGAIQIQAGQSSASLSLARCFVTGCRADIGGGVYAYNESVKLEGCTFYQNHASERGGAVFASGGSVSGQFLGSLFQENHALTGGALDVSAPFVLKNCSLVGNTAGFSGLPNGGDGGAIATNNRFTAADSAFVDNTATQTGGAIRVMSSYDNTLESCVFISNSAQSTAGAVAVMSSSLAMVNVLFAKNTTTGQGGALYISDAGVPPDHSLRGVSFVGNTAGSGGAIAAKDLTLLDYAIFSGNTAQSGIGADILALDTGGKITMKFAAIQGGAAHVGGNVGAINNGNGFVPGIAGNIDADPLFVKGPKGDYYLAQTAAGQAQTSPCVDPVGSGVITAVAAAMDALTTRSDGVGDTGTLDMGYHYPP